MKAAIYTRVSTEEQANGGHSLTTQEELCRQYAGAHGLEVARAYSDTLTGATLDRPGLQDMLVAAEAGEVQAIIVHANDRLTRDRMHLGLILERLLRSETELHFVNTGRFDFESPEARMMLGLLGEFANYWREKIRMNARLGRRRRAQRGKIVLSGPPPYGYRFNLSRDNLVIDEGEAEVVRRIFETYGTAGSVSLSAIAGMLEGTPTPADQGHGPAAFASKRVTAAGRWGKRTIALILASPTYSGTWVYGRSRTRLDGQVVPSDDTVIVDVPPIVSKAVQAKAIARLEENKGRRDARAKRPYLLAGHIRCGTCGKAYTGLAVTGGGTEYTYYRCRSRIRRNSPDGKTLCPSPTVPLDWLEVRTLWFLVKVYSSPEHREAIAAGRERNRSAEDTLPEQLARVDARLAGLGSKRATLLAALDGAGSGPSAKAIGKKLAGLDDDEARLKAERRDLENAPRVLHFDGKKLAAWAGGMFARGDVGEKLTTAAIYVDTLSKFEWPKDGSLERILELRNGTPEEAGQAAAMAFERVRRMMREVQLLVIVHPDNRVDWQARIPDGSGGSTDVHDSGLAFLTLKRPG